MEKAVKRKEKSKINKKLGNMSIPTRRNSKIQGPAPPACSVCFVDNSARGILVKRMQECEQEMGDHSNYRVRMTEAAGTL